MLLFKYIQRVILVVVKRYMTKANKHKKFIYTSAQFIRENKKIKNKKSEGV